VKNFNPLFVDKGFPVPCNFDTASQKAISDTIDALKPLAIYTGVFCGFTTGWNWVLGFSTGWKGVRYRMGHRLNFEDFDDLNEI
jgi:hypothetical protein